VCTSLAGSVVHHYGCTFCSQRLGDGGSDAFGCACDDCDFTCEFAHCAVIPFVDMSTARVTRCQISVRPGISWFAAIPVGSPGCYVAAVALVDQALGIYDGNESRAWFNTRNPFFWIT